MFKLVSRGGLMKRHFHIDDVLWILIDPNVMKVTLTTLYIFVLLFVGHSFSTPVRHGINNLLVTK